VLKTTNKPCFVWWKIALLVFVSLVSQPLFVSVQADDDDDEFENGQVVVKLDPSSLTIPVYLST
jgi:hypothetical protein